MKFSCALETASQSTRLVHVMSHLIKAGYTLISQKQEPSKNGGNIIYVMARSEQAKSQADLVEDLEAISGCTLLKLAIADGEGSPSKKRILDEKGALAAIGTRYPDIVEVVKQYENSLAKDDRANALKELGRKVGAGIYQRDYALGSPLKMSAAISRELVPALKAFSKIKSSDQVITLVKCPFCSSQTSSESACHFVTGYISGFLSDNPAIKKAEVVETSCGSGSTNICEFSIS